MKGITLRLVLGLILVLIVSACSNAPQPIEFGKDQCSFCVMNIVDNSHAAQYVTKKGKQFKFDAIECMVMDLNKKETVDYTTILVANFSTPGEMIDATHAIYIISPEIKSPMGANLSAVDTQEKALELHNEHTGELYSWTELIAKFKE